MTCETKSHFFLTSSSLFNQFHFPNMDTEESEDTEEEDSSSSSTCSPTKKNNGQDPPNKKV